MKQLFWMGLVVGLGAVACDESATEADGDSGGGGDSAQGGASEGGGAQGGGASEGGGAQGGGAQGGGAQGGGEPTWGEEDPGVTVGPFGEFKLFRSGCGEQLWGRWIPRSDFALGVQTIGLPGGGSVETTYFDAPVFLEDEKTVYLFDQNGGFNDGVYNLQLKVGNPDQSVLTHSLSAPADGLFRWSGQIELSNAFNDAQSRLNLQVTPTISGNVGRLFVYDAAECVVASLTLLDPVPLSAGVTTEINTMAQGLASGEPYTVAFQGVDAARDYLYFATVELQAP